MHPRVRRLLFIVTAGAVLSRLYVLGQDKGFELVARATVSVTLVSVGAWLVHVVLHELAHWAAARSQDFEVRGVRFGPVSFDFTGAKVRVRRGEDLGGGVMGLPRGVASLRKRLRVVASAGPLMTLLATGGAVLLFVARQEPSLASPLGIFVVMGGFTFVTAMLPGVLLPSRPESGTDLEQLILPRAVYAYWVNAAALQGVGQGQRVNEAVDWRETESLLPVGGDVVEPLEVAWCMAAIESGEVKRAWARLRSMEARLTPDSPEWQRTDTFNQLGCLTAFEGDVVHARACLAEVKLTQSQPWYCELLVACIARAEGDVDGERAALARWFAGADASPVRVYAVAGNRWVLERLGADWADGSARVLRDAGP